MLSISNHQGNANQNHNEWSSHTCQNGFYSILKRQETTNVVQGMEKGDTLALLVGVQIGADTREDNTEVPYLKLK